MSLNSKSKYPSDRAYVLKLRSDARPHALAGRLEHLMFAMAGSLVGASATVATAWFTQKTLSRRELIREEMRKREILYGEFISDCAKLLMDAAATSEAPRALCRRARSRNSDQMPTVR